YSVIIMIVTALFVFLVWWVTVIFRLRLAFVPRAKRAVSGGGCALPLLLLAALPVAGLVLWGLNTAYSTEAARRVEDISNLGNAFGNTVAPWAVIWGLQLPITYLAGLALGFVRPLGRV